MSITITAKYPGKCAFPKCGKSILPDQEVNWEQETKKVFCVDHPEEKVAKVK